MLCVHKRLAAPRQTKIARAETEFKEKFRCTATSCEQFSRSGERLQMKQEAHECEYKMLNFFEEEEEDCASRILRQQVLALDSAGGVMFRRYIDVSHHGVMASDSVLGPEHDPYPAHAACSIAN